MKVSIVIPAINEAHSIARSVEMAWKAGADEVIVVDGGSGDATVEICEKANCRLVHSPAGRGIQLNAGAAKAIGDVLLFLHADNWLVENAIQQIKSLDDDPDVLFGGFYQRIEHPGKLFRWIEGGNAWRVRWRGLVYGDQAMFVSKSLFEAAGGFRAIALMEDLAFSQEIKSQYFEKTKRSRPHLLAGPTHVDARRWQAVGPVRQTLKNWFLSTAYVLGADPKRLAKRYGRHDGPS